MVLQVTPRMPYYILRTLKEIFFYTGYAQEAHLGQHMIMQYAHFFTGILSRPRSLQEECRGIIREVLGTAPFLKTSRLPLPSRVQDFLLMTDIFNYEEDFKNIKDIKSVCNPSRPAKDSTAGNQPPDSNVVTITLDSAVDDSPPVSNGACLPADSNVDSLRPDPNEDGLSEDSFVSCQSDPPADGLAADSNVDNPPSDSNVGGTSQGS